MATSSTRSAAFAMLCLIWGSTWLAIRIGLEGAPPFLSASLRFAVASIVLVLLAVVFRSKWPQNRTEWALVGFVGIVLIFRSQHGSAGPGQVFPMLSIVLAATCAAFATVAVKRWGHDTEPISFNAASMAVGAGALAGVSLIAREPWAVPTWPQGLGAILYLAIAGSVVTFVAWQWLLKEMQATFLSYIALVIPIVDVLLGASLGNETLDVIDLAGAGIVLLGIYVSTSRRAAAFARAAMGQGIAEPDPVDPPPRKT